MVLSSTTDCGGVPSYPGAPACLLLAGVIIRTAFENPTQAVSIKIAPNKPSQKVLSAAQYIPSNYKVSRRLLWANSTLPRGNGKRSFVSLKKEKRDRVENREDLLGRRQLQSSPSRGNSLPSKAAGFPFGNPLSLLGKANRCLSFPGIRAGILSFTFAAILNGSGNGWLTCCRRRRGTQSMATRVGCYGAFVKRQHLRCQKALFFMPNERNLIVFCPPVVPASPGWLTRTLNGADHGTVL